MEENRDTSAFARYGRLLFYRVVDPVLSGIFYGIGYFLGSLTVRYFVMSFLQRYDLIDYQAFSKKQPVKDAPQTAMK